VNNERMEREKVAGAKKERKVQKITEIEEQR
jgi:hypothetical protein